MSTVTGGESLWFQCRSHLFKERRDDSGGCRIIRAVNFLGFKKLGHEQSRARMLAFVALAQHGVLNDPGELENLKFADPEGAAQSVSDARNIGVGIKVRLHKKDVGDNGREALRLAVRAGEACKASVMVHIGNTAISMEEIVDTLRPGDVVTHCYTPQQPAIVDE